jgi:DNA-binding LacI/PurR family transcriptional regulator
MNKGASGNVPKLQQGTIMPTLEDLALEAGVSKATVSRVINERGNVSPETVRLVREAMIRTQFTAPSPKPPRSAPVKSRQTLTSALSVYALLVPEISGDLYVSLLRGFEAASQPQMHQTIVCNTNNNVLKQADDLMQLMHKQVNGIAIVPVSSSPTPLAHISVVQSVGIPVVLLHRDVEGASAPLIALPLRQIGARAGKELMDRGHTRIAFFTSEGSSSGITHREGLEESMRKRGLNLANPLICSCEGAIPLSLPSLEEAVAREVNRLWSLDEAQRPTGIYVTSSVIAEVLYMKLLERGLRIGKDVSLLTCGASERFGAINSRLTSITVNERQIGHYAIELLEQSRQSRQNGTEENSERLVRHAELSFATGETLGQACA